MNKEGRDNFIKEILFEYDNQNIFNIFHSIINISERDSILKFRFKF